MNTWKNDRSNLIGIIRKVKSIHLLVAFCFLYGLWSRFGDGIVFGLMELDKDR